MGREIELKAALSKEQFLSIWKILTTEGKDLCLLLKNDEYYSKYSTREERIKNGEPQVIRIRSEKKAQIDSSMLKKSYSYQELEAFFSSFANSPDEKSESYFTIKTKKIEDGTEFNSEDETYVSEPNVLRNFFCMMKFSKYFGKQKIALSSNISLLKNSSHLLHAELELVNGLRYLEIECTASSSSPSQVKAELEETFKYLGADLAKKDSRSWKEIIESSK